MAEMTSAELSLAVAGIMYPEYKWKIASYRGGDCAVIGRAGGWRRCKLFDYKDCAWDMAVWLASNATLSTQKSMPYLLRMDDAIFQLAMAIKKAGKDACGIKEGE